MKSILLVLLATLGFIWLCHWTTGEEWGPAGGEVVGVGGGTFNENGLWFLFSLAPWLGIAVFFACIGLLVAIAALIGGRR